MESSPDHKTEYHPCDKCGKELKNDQGKRCEECIKKESVMDKLLKN